MLARLLPAILAVTACSVCPHGDVPPLVSDDFGADKARVQTVVARFRQWTEGVPLCVTAVELVDTPVEQGAATQQLGSYGSRSGTLRVERAAVADDLEFIMVHEMCHAIRRQARLGPWRDQLGADDLRDHALYGPHYEGAYLWEAFARACELGPQGSALLRAHREQCLDPGAPPPEEAAHATVYAASLPPEGYRVDRTDWVPEQATRWLGAPELPAEDAPLNSKIERDGRVLLRSWRPDRETSSYVPGAVVTDAPPQRAFDPLDHGIVGWEAERMATTAEGAQVVRLRYHGHYGTPASAWAVFDDDGMRWVHTDCRAEHTTFVADAVLWRFDVDGERLTWSLPAP